MKYRTGDVVRWKTDARNSEQGVNRIVICLEHDPHPYLIILDDDEWLNLSEDEILEVVR